MVKIFRNREPQLTNADGNVEPVEVSAIDRRKPSRRDMLLGAGMLSAGLLLTACGGGEEAPKPTVTASETATPGASETSADMAGKTKLELTGNPVVDKFRAGLVPEKLVNMTPAEMTAAATIKKDMINSPETLAQLFSACQEAQTNAGATWEEVEDFGNSEASRLMTYGEYAVKKYEPLLKGCHVGVSEPFLIGVHDTNHMTEPGNRSLKNADLYHVNFKVDTKTVRMSDDGELTYVQTLKDNAYSAGDTGAIPINRVDEVKITGITYLSNGDVKVGRWEIVDEKDLTKK